MLPLFKNPKTPNLRKTPDYKHLGLRSRRMLLRLPIEKRILIWWTLLQSILSLPSHMQFMNPKCIQWIWVFQWTQCLRKNWLDILNKFWILEGINLFICYSLLCSQCLIHMQGLHYPYRLNPRHFQTGLQGTLRGTGPFIQRAEQRSHL